MIYAGFFVLVFFVAACAEKVWYKPGVTDLTYKQDRFRCMQVSGYSDPSPGEALLMGAGAGVAAGQNPTAVYLANSGPSPYAMFNACMEALGYQLRPEDEVTALKKK
jgi:hypothetical protein